MCSLLAICNVTQAMESGQLSGVLLVATSWACFRVGRRQARIWNSLFFVCGKPPPASAPSHHELPIGELEGQDCSIRAILARRCARGRPRTGLTAGGRHEAGMPALGPLTQACRSRPRPTIASSQLAPIAQPTATRGVQNRAAAKL